MAEEKRRTTFTFLLPAKMLKALTRVAKEQERSVSWVIREFVQKGLHTQGFFPPSKKE